jgi:hypothetical protein
MDSPICWVLPQYHSYLVQCREGPALNLRLYTVRCDLIIIIAAHLCIRLNESHSGKYLAQVTADCLCQFGLAEKVFTVLTCSVRIFMLTCIAVSHDLHR